MSQSFDVEQLYTHIPHEDLFAKIKEVIYAVFEGQTKRLIAAQAAGELEVPDPGIITVKNVGLVLNSDGTHEFVSPAKRLALLEQPGRRVRVYTADILVDLVVGAVTNCCVTIGRDVLVQGRGIPQGMNASPFLANLYLFAYELAFMKQFLRPGPYRGDFHIFKANFGIVVRFQDDRWSAMALMEQRAMSLEKRWSPELPLPQDTLLAAFDSDDEALYRLSL